MTPSITPSPGEGPGRGGAEVTGPPGEGPVRRPGVPAEVIKGAATAAGVEVEVMERAIGLALRGGPDKVSPGWNEGAACRDLGADRFYPRRADRDYLGLVALCRGSCPVQAECLGSAVAGGERQGLWGGTSGAGRARMRGVLRHAGLFGVTGEAAYVSWQEEGARREPPPPDEAVAAGKRATSRPWPHQVDAVRAVAAAIGSGGRCRITMAPASGKTLTGMWAAAELDAARVLVQVPSLSLVGQTIEEWRRNGPWPAAEYLAVCCDTDAELGIEATTDADRVRSFLADAEPGRPRVVVATYHSSPVLAAAAVTYDLAIEDEAHHLAGERAKPFAAVVRGEIGARRILFMSATPRRYRKHGDDLEVVGMDDQESFGPEVFRLQLSEAVDAGIVADYRVVVAAVDRATFDRVAAHPGLSDIDPQLLAGAIAVVRAMGEFDLRSLISFHSRVERARVFAGLVGIVAEALPPNDRPPGPGWTAWVHGGTPVGIRQRLLTRIADPATWGLIANDQALGEGVDVPVLDGIAIVDRKSSDQSCLQALGRALRRPGGARKVGTVILPVLISGEVDGDDPLAGVDKAGLEVVAGVLRALRAHDDALGDRLDFTRRAVGRSATTNPGVGSLLRQRAARGLLQSRVELWVPGGATGELAGAIALRLVRDAASEWDENLGRLRAWADAYGSAAPPQAAGVADGEGGTFGIGAWCCSQRSLHRRGLLGPERVQALEALAGWSWDPRSGQWWELFDALVDWCSHHGSPDCPQRTTWRGLALGSWCNTMRMSYKAGRLDAERVAALEGLAGWRWDIRASKWESHFAELTRWAAEHGHANPSSGDLVDGFDIGTWVTKQRGALTRGTLEVGRADRLRALVGWVDDERDALWERGYGLLAAWAAQHGHATPALGVKVDGFGLGTWVNKQRGRARGGQLEPVRAKRLESLPGWFWERDRWDDMYQSLLGFAAREGHGRVPDRHVEAGLGLGAWVVARRTDYRHHRLAAERIDQLEELPGWSWSPYDDSFDGGLAALVAFRAREGHCDPPGAHQEGTVTLGTWVRRVRHEKAAGTLTAERRARLDAVDGWWWDRGADQAWDDAFERLRAWAERAGHPNPPVSLSIGSWVSKQKSLYRDGRLAARRAERLESLPGWRWQRAKEASWDQAFEVLRAWAEITGHANPAQPVVVDDQPIGVWVDQQRSFRRAGRLSDERAVRLEALPGWNWQPLEQRWWDNYGALADWAANHGTANCPQHTVWQNRQLGTWVNTVRGHHKSGILTPDRVEALERLAGWSWCVIDAVWETHFQAVAGWAARNGHARPSADQDIVDGFDIGRWVTKQRAAIRSGRLDAERTARLRSLPGWVDHEREALWEAGFAHLAAWADEHGHAAPPRNHICRDGYQLGGWVVTQRGRQQKRRLDPARAARLEALPGWHWHASRDRQ